MHSILLKLGINFVLAASFFCRTSSTTIHYDDNNNLDGHTQHPVLYSFSSNDDTGIKIAIFIPTFLIFVIILFCKYCVCGEGCCEETSTYTTLPTVHAPPSRGRNHISSGRIHTIQPPANTEYMSNRGNYQSSNIRTFRTPPMTNPVALHSPVSGNNYEFDSENRRTFMIPPLSTPVMLYTPSSGNNYGTSGADTSYDKPPDYSAVVTSDLNRKDTFPGVQSKNENEAPPPYLTENSLKKY